VPMVLLAFVQPAEARRFLWWDFPDAPPSGQYDQRRANYDDLTPQERFNLRQYELYRREMYRRYGRSAFQDPGPDYGYDNPSIPYADPVKKPPKRKVVATKPVVKPVAKPDVANTAASTTTSAPANSSASPTSAAATIDTTAAATVDTTATARANDTTAVASTAPITLPPAPTAAAIAAATPAAMQTAASTTTGKAKPGSAVTCDKGMGIVSSFGFSNVVSKSCTGKSLVYSAERGGNKFEVEVNGASGELTAVRKL
jgi:hypothetical protein